mgnify:CR=1 FL=1
MFVALHLSEFIVSQNNGMRPERRSTLFHCCMQANPMTLDQVKQVPVCRHLGLFPPTTTPHTPLHLQSIAAHTQRKRSGPETSRLEPFSFPTHSCTRSTIERTDAESPTPLTLRRSEESPAAAPASARRSSAALTPARDTQ